MPLVALLRLMHLGIALAAAVLRQTRRREQRGVHHRTDLQDQTMSLKTLVDRIQQRARQLVLLQEMPESE